MFLYCSAAVSFKLAVFYDRLAFICYNLIFLVTIPLHVYYNSDERTPLPFWREDLLEAVPKLWFLL